MKLKFKIQPYQTAAVDSIVDCFAGRPNTSGLTYKIDPGMDRSGGSGQLDIDRTGFRNAGILISDSRLLDNIHEVQKRQNLHLSGNLVSSAGCNVNLDVEMETGTGKTYCCIKTIFEMNKRYGWSKFIIIVPSIAIREGVLKSLEITAEHFMESYGRKARFFAYNSKHLHHLESFSSDAGINVMVINIQAFNATGKDNRRIYDELDDFQSRKPIDVISGNRPILILDEPQKMEGKKTLEALAGFNPLMILRYSATHRTIHNKVHRLDALDAYNQKLVKKISVRGITVKGPAGTNAYLYLESIEISLRAPVARIELEVRQESEIKRIVKRLGRGTDLFAESNELDQYRGFVISQIDANNDTVEFTNGKSLTAGDATGDVTEMAVRRIQIREAIRAHMDKECSLYSRNIKVLSLFFIDEVAKYRDYSRENEQGEYACIFEEEYGKLRNEYLGELPLDVPEYRKYLAGIDVRKTHDGYFSIDKKTRRLANPKFKTRGESAGMSQDVEAYDLILKDKERLLSFDEPVRFIFSHSALREGWDNPNVFVMCMLKHSDNTISRRQEVGRGLRISVDDRGERQDNPATVHDVNILTVIAGESYKEFVDNLQKEIDESLSVRPGKADEAYFTGKIIRAETGTVEITPVMARQIYRYLLKNDYIDDSDHVSGIYHKAKAENTLVDLPAELASYKDQVFPLINSVFSGSQLPGVDDDRKPKTNPLNANFRKKEFQELWNRINRKAVYRVEFDSGELIKNCIKTLDGELRVSPLRYTVQSGRQASQASYDQIKSGQAFIAGETRTEYGTSVHSSVAYDLLGKISENTKLTRKTISLIISAIHPNKFALYKMNPEHFISESSRLINEQKAAAVIEKLTYDSLADTHGTAIFTSGQSRQDFSKAGEKLQKHIYDYAVTDSRIEQEFARELDSGSEVVVYAKLPNGFAIPTPVGDYNPDWAISFREGSVKYIYFIAETKGSMSSLQLRGIEHTKIECARKFFAEINRKIDSENVKYDVVDSYEKLMEVVV